MAKKRKLRTDEEIWEFDKLLYQLYESQGIIDYSKIDEIKKSEIEADIKCSTEIGDKELVEAMRLCIKLGLEFNNCNFSLILWRLGCDSSVAADGGCKVITAKRSEYSTGTGYFSIRVMRDNKCNSDSSEKMMNKYVTYKRAW